MSYYEQLRMLRERMGLTQEAFCRRARQLGLFMTVRRYRRIETDGVKLSLKELAVIVKTLGISADELVYFDDSLAPEPNVGTGKRALVSDLAKGLQGLRQ